MEIDVGEMCLFPTTKDVPFLLLFIVTFNLLLILDGGGVVSCFGVQEN